MEICKVTSSSSALMGRIWSDGETLAMADIGRKKMKARVVKALCSLFFFIVSVGSLVFK